MLSTGFSKVVVLSCQVWIGALGPLELRIICEKGLLLLAVTIPEMEVIVVVCLNSIWCFFVCNENSFLSLAFTELIHVYPASASEHDVVQHVLWPFILKMVILRKYTQAVATVRDLLIPLFPFVFLDKTSNCSPVCV